MRGAPEVYISGRPRRVAVFEVSVFRNMGTSRARRYVFVTRDKGVALRLARGLGARFDRRFMFHSLAAQAVRDGWYATDES